MKHKTSELTGTLLDAAVAKAERKTVTKTPEGESGTWIEVGWPEGRLPYAPSSDWSHGGPIIEREGIGLHKGHGTWIASLPYAENQYGDTPLIAAMRAYVASKLGDEVEL